MSQFATARRTMVDNQLRTTDVTDARVLASFGSVPREMFVPAARQALAYFDEAHRLETAPTAPARWLPAPSPFAKLVQLAEIGSTESVLVVGCGTGYSVAIIAGLAARVTGLEVDADLARAAASTLAGLGLAGASIVTGPLTAGWPAAAPYDVILFEGAVDSLPPAFAGQLADQGRLVVVEGRGPSALARVYVKSGQALAGRNAFNMSARTLPGFERAAEFVF